MTLMNDRRFVLAGARLVRASAAVDPDVERVRRHVARIRLQIQELERRLRQTGTSSPTIRNR